MDIKQANVLLLLGKIKELLVSLSPEVKKGEKFVAAEKALGKLDELFAGKEGEVQLLACRKGQPVMGG